MGSKVKNRQGIKRVTHVLLATNQLFGEHFWQKAKDVCAGSVTSQYICLYPRLVRKMSLLTSDCIVAESAIKFSVNHWRLMSCSLRIAGNWFVVVIHFVVSYSLKWYSGVGAQLMKKRLAFSSGMQQIQRLIERQTTAIISLIILSIYH